MREVDPLRRSQEDPLRRSTSVSMLDRDLFEATFAGGFFDHNSRSRVSGDCLTQAETQAEAEPTGKAARRPSRSLLEEALLIHQLYADRSWETPKPEGLRERDCTRCRTLELAV